MENFIKDLKYGARMLLRSKAFSLIAVLSLALGIGANTAIFSLVQTMLFSPFPVEEPARLASIFTTDQRNPGNLPMSHLNFKDYRDQNASFSGTAAVTFAQVNMLVEQSSEQILAQVVTGNYFDVLGMKPAAGRTFRPDEDATPGSHPVVVLSHGLWTRRFGGDPAIVGKTLTLNRQPFSVIGVAAEGFTGTFLFGAPDIWVPMMMHDAIQPGFDWYEQRRGLFLFAFCRLKPGVSLAQADANLKTIASQLEASYPTDNKGRSAATLPLLEARTNPNGGGANPIARTAILLMVVVGLVLLIACANIANLLLARAAGRQREIAMRLALGASRWRLMRQLLTESVLLALLGGAAGLVVAFWTIDALRTVEIPIPANVLLGLTLDARVLTFALVVSVLTGLLFGLAPALQATKPDVVPVLKNELVPSAGASPRRFLRWFNLRKGLVVSQVALSLVALVAAGLFLRSLRQTQNIDPGFETSGVLMANVNLGREGYTPERGQLLYRQIVERVQGLPGVRAASIAQGPPFGNQGFQRSVFLEGRDTSERDRILVQVNPVGVGYFRTLGIPIERGRDFTIDDDDTAPDVVVINQTMADRFWKGEDAIGKRFKFFGDEEFRTVVGIARDAKYNGLAEDPTPFIYQPITQAYTPAATILVRSSGDASALANPVRAEIGRLDSRLSVLGVQTLGDQVTQQLGPQRLMVTLLGAFGLLALGLAAMGLYGVASYSVTQRTREIGVRMALGAKRGDVVWLVLGQGMALVAFGLIVGLVIALMAAPMIRELLVQVAPFDPAAFGGTALLLAIVATLATWLPARRAASIDPLIALRYE
ncbi:MAG TPA: ABC transporter permease [Vicinamibacterales bacterium]|nr:ABC transporter permease [Vicinamibacterales bacterium]